MHRQGAWTDRVKGAQQYTSVLIMNELVNGVIPSIGNGSNALTLNFCGKWRPPAHFRCGLAESPEFI